ncbi:MAG TPA: hypothetical protein VFY29_05220 [Terriglobia bacterium]|nr:hypothetical protein [Terriglobia bacterium]
MKHRIGKKTLALLLIGLFMNAAAGAQAAPRGRGGAPAPAVESAAATAPSPQTPPQGDVPLKIQVVISRFDGDRKISSLPYTISATSGRQSSLRMGTRVPVISGSSPDNKQPPSFQFIDVGTNLDVTATPIGEGEFRLQLTMTESSVLEATSTAPKGNVAPGQPLVGNFSYTSNLVLKDGKTHEVLASVNKATGETVKLEITLTVEK